MPLPPGSTHGRGDKSLRAAARQQVPTTAAMSRSPGDRQENMSRVRSQCQGFPRQVKKPSLTAQQCSECPTSRLRQGRQRRAFAAQPLFRHGDHTLAGKIAKRHKLSASHCIPFWQSDPKTVFTRCVDVEWPTNLRSIAEPEVRRTSPYPL